MKFFKRNDDTDDVIELADELAGELTAFAFHVSKPITDYAADAATAMLEYADAEITECDAKIIEYEDRRRRAVLVREASGPTLAKLETGFDPVPGVSGPRSGRKSAKPALIAAE